MVEQDPYGYASVGTGGHAGDVTEGMLDCIGPSAFVCIKEMVMIGQQDLERALKCTSMQASVQNTFKNVVLSAWKERWSEQKWTMKMRTLLQPGSTADMFQMADVLFTQAFIGSSPNMVLLSYFNYGLRSGTFTYAAVLSAISKHEDLQNVKSMEYTLKLLMTYINKLNEGQILEECMALCRALLLLLQWLIRNIEQYLKGVHDVPMNDAERIIAVNCQTLNALTTMPRTSSLLTIERFEESSVWSHIETDLAVIKNAAVGHPTQGDVNRSCQHVSQLARCHTKTLAAFSLPKVVGNESNHSMLLNMLILLEGEWNKTTDGDTLVQQFLLIAQLCDLNAADLCLDIIRACMMGFLGSIKTPGKYKWCSILFLVLPQHLNRLKSAIASGNSSSEIKLPSVDKDFETSAASAFTKLLQYDSLLDMLDQVTGNVNCLQWILDQCLTYQVLREEDVTALKHRRDSSASPERQPPSYAVDPNLLIKYETTARQLLSLIDISDYVSKQDNLLSTLSQMSSNFNIILASASVSQNVQKYASKLIMFNDVVKTSTGEGGKAAQTRCLLFDFTFFLVCQIAQQYGKAIVVNSMPADDTKPFLYNWIRSFWPNDRWPLSGNPAPNVEIDDSRVQTFISVLRKGQEQTASLKKWHDMCINLPNAFIELIKGWQYGVVTEGEIMTACDVVGNVTSLAVRLCCLVLLEKFAQEVPRKFKNKEIKSVTDKLLKAAPDGATSQELLFEKRFAMFKSACEILLPSCDTDLKTVPGIPSGLCKPKADDFAADKLRKLFSHCEQAAWIDQDTLTKLDELYRQTGAKWFCQQLVNKILLQTRKDLVEKTVTVVSGMFLIDVESLTICLLRHEIPHYLTHDADHMLLSAPAGNILAQVAVSCLAIVLHNMSLQQKACLAPKTKKERLSHQLLMSGSESFVSHQSHTQDESGPTKLRRLFSSTAEHDLSGGAFSSILGLASENASSTQSKHAHVREPVLRALSYSLDVMHMALGERQPGPHIDFAVYFVYLASCCGELVSQAVLQLMPLSMVTELTAQIDRKSNLYKAEDFDSMNFALSISDLGHALSRKVAAKAVSQISLK